MLLPRLPREARCEPCQAEMLRQLRASFHRFAVIAEEMGGATREFSKIPPVRDNGRRECRRMRTRAGRCARRLGWWADRGTASPRCRWAYQQGPKGRTPCRARPRQVRLDRAAAGAQDETGAGQVQRRGRSLHNDPESASPDTLGRRSAYRFQPGFGDPDRSSVASTRPKQGKLYGSGTTRWSGIARVTDRSATCPKR